jgi:hypothetical protein
MCNIGLRAQDSATSTIAGLAFVSAISLSDDATFTSLASLHYHRTFATSCVLSYDQWIVAGKCL